MLDGDLGDDIMLHIREGKADDAPSIARMICDFNVEDDMPGRVDATVVTDLCFTPTSVYRAFVAEDGDRLVGYALVMGFFDTDPCAWSSYMQDLFVVPEHRSQGVGRRLIASVAKATVEEGRRDLVWHVRDQNERGRAFYAAIGGEEQTALMVTLGGDALQALAKGA